MLAKSVFFIEMFVSLHFSDVIITFTVSAFLMLFALMTELIISDKSIYFCMFQIMLTHDKLYWLDDLMLSLRSLSERSDDSHMLCFHRVCLQMRALLQRKARLHDELSFTSSLDFNALCLNWSSSRVSSWHFEFDSIRSQVAHIFNLTRVKLLIFSIRRDSIRLRIESTRLDSSRTQAWRQES